MPKIALSYRRADSSAISGRIFDRLSQHFGPAAVFMDIDLIPLGVDFRDHIREELSSTDILLAIVGPRWLGATPDGQHRIDDETDPVRVEIEIALRRDIPIIPILVDQAQMPGTKDLPATLHNFSFKHAITVDTGIDFNAHIARLLRSMDQILARRDVERSISQPPSDTPSKQSQAEIATAGKPSEKPQAPLGATTPVGSSGQQLKFGTEPAPPNRADESSTVAARTRLGEADLAVLLPGQTGWLPWPEALIGFGLLIFAGLVLWSTSQIPVSPLYAKIGPTIFPYISAAGLTLFAVLLIVQAARGGWQPAEEKEVPIDWHALGFVAAGLIVNVVLIVPLGFTAASTAMFVLITYAFGSRNILRDAAIGFAIALVAYFGFAKLLGVNIGAGLIEGLLGG